MVSLHAQDAGYRTDSLERLLVNENLPDGERLNIYKDISREFYPAAPRKAVHYAEKGIALAEETDDRENAFILYTHLADAYRNLNNYDSALMYSGKAIELSPSVNSVEGRQRLGLVFLCTGSICAIKNRYDEALDRFFRSMKIAEEIDDKILLMKIYGGIGYVYSCMRNDEQTENYYRKMEHLGRATGNVQQLAHALYSLSTAAYNTKRYETALRYAEEAYRIITQYPDADFYDLIYACKTLSTAWVIYDSDKALTYTEEALAYAEKSNVPLYKSDILYEMAAVQSDRKEYAAAEQTAFRALEADTTNLSLRGSLYCIIAEANIMLGNKEKAREYLDRFSGWISDYIEQTYQSSLSEMEVKYETEKKETRIATLEDHNRLVTRLGIATGTALLLALLAFIFLWRWMVQKKALAEQQIKQLEQEKRLIATQAVLDGEVQERTRLARDLHDGLGSILAAAKYNFVELKKSTADREPLNMERYDMAVGLLDDSIHEMRRVAHHLMPDALSRFGLKTALSDFCDTLPP
jgi:tetratricopeptide (TPR) repeat protein